MVGSPVTLALPTGPLALFLDVDGTLIDIAPCPDAVVVPEPLRQALGRLGERLNGALALVSGRSIADLDTLFRPLRFRAAGVHGAEMRTEPDGAVSARDGDALPADFIAAVRHLAAGHAGTLVENKGYSVAVHYRADPSAGPALRAGLDALVAETGPGLQVLPGHMVFDVKRSDVDKGVAITAFMAHAPFAGRQPVFIGDDVTDLSGFAAVLAAGGLAYSVTTPRPGLSGHFADPQTVRDWVAALAGMQP